ncbi:Uncharacterised protein [Mycoplasma putrefaciens]|uniref:Lipoprotein n=1 Tax=Mycoplasma putrefaciens (strain ATCC 15718 / NCTC 10155 / C30 KS-1 / KS-1) TaxID=743965 RepID=A0A7U4E999_MYCPK|nr:hypothetical protein [Mycoplasma putrefaciens]AEM68425.1 hypothetical protein MPUT_0017 [Mycoplasma putrefaciens KS1]SYV94749.1 Uncharacterised protein [Mycoplasma putrefaciens]
MKKLLSILGSVGIMTLTGMAAVAYQNTNRTNKPIAKVLTDEENFQFIKDKGPKIEKLLHKVSEGSGETNPNFTESEHDILSILAKVYEIYKEAKGIKTFSQALEVLNKKGNGSSQDKQESRRELSNFLKGLVGSYNSKEKEIESFFQKYNVS